MYLSVLIIASKQDNNLVVLQPLYTSESQVRTELEEYNLTQD